MHYDFQFSSLFFLLGQNVILCLIQSSLCINKYLISGSPCSRWISFLCLYHRSFLPNMCKNSIFKRESSCKMSLAELFPLLVLQILLNLGTTAGDILLFFKFLLEYSYFTVLLIFTVQQSESTVHLHRPLFFGFPPH